MKKFIFDILRDKGSEKYSITKTLALIMSLFFVSYLSYHTMYLKQEIDHTLVIEMIGFISALVGMKNNWGISRSKTTNSDGTSMDATKMDLKIERKPNDNIDDEVEF